MLGAFSERTVRCEELIPFECLLVQEEPVLESKEGEDDNTGDF